MTNANGAGLAWLYQGTPRAVAERIGDATETGKDIEVLLRTIIERGDAIWDWVLRVPIAFDIALCIPFWIWKDAWFFEWLGLWGTVGLFLGTAVAGALVGWWVGYKRHNSSKKLARSQLLDLVRDDDDAARVLAVFRDYDTRWPYKQLATELLGELNET